MSPPNLAARLSFLLFACVPVGRCGIGDNRIYWKIGWSSRLNIRPYILLNLYPVKLKSI